MSEEPKKTPELEDWIKQEVHRAVKEHVSSPEFLHALVQKIEHIKTPASVHPHMERKLRHETGGPVY